MSAIAAFKSTDAIAAFQRLSGHQLIAGRLVRSTV